MGNLLITLPKFAKKNVWMNFTALVQFIGISLQSITCNFLLILVNQFCQDILIALCLWKETIKKTQNLQLLIWQQISLMNSETGER